MKFITPGLEPRGAPGPMAGNTARARSFRVLGGIRIELRLATLRAKVVRLPVVLARPRRLRWIDLRPEVTPVQGWRPGSVARTGGAILCEAPDRYLMLFGDEIPVTSTGKYQRNRVKHLFDHDMVADAKVEGDKITLTKPPFTLSSMKTFAAEAAGLVSEEMFFDADETVQALIAAYQLATELPPARARGRQPGRGRRPSWPRHSARRRLSGTPCAST